MFWMALWQFLAVSGRAKEVAWYQISFVNTIQVLWDQRLLIDSRKKYAIKSV